jgi:hypothetical protein
MKLESHFAGTDPAVRATDERLIEVARAFGPVTEGPKKTSLILALKSARDIRNRRIHTREQTSANGWHLEMRFEQPADIDRQVTTLRRQCKSPHQSRLGPG